MELAIFFVVFAAIAIVNLGAGLSGVKPNGYRARSATKGVPLR